MLRVFYRKSNSQIVWNSSLDGDGVFPRTVEEELEKLPDIMVGATLTSEGAPLGGKPEDYACIEVTDQPTISAFMASDSNTVVGGKLVTGVPRPIVIPVDSPDKITLKKYLADPHSGLPDLETAFQALVRLYLGV